MDIYVQKDGQPQGPFSEEQVRTRISTGVFVPEDLASTTGQPPWQPLSTLINLAKLSPSGSGHSGSTILYQDTDEFLESRPFEDDMIPRVPKVTVEHERLKVGNNSYLLDGVTSVTLSSPLERISAATLVRKLAFWTWFWLSLIPLGYACWVERGKQSSWSVTFLWFIFCGVPFVLAKLASRKDIKQCYHHAVVCLMRAGQPTKIFIGGFRRAPGWISQERDLWKNGITEANREKLYEQRKAYFNQSVSRIQQISEAIGQAIKGKPTAEQNRHSAV